VNVCVIIYQINSHNYQPFVDEHLDQLSLVDLINPLESPSVITHNFSFGFFGLFETTDGHHKAVKLFLSEHRQISTNFHTLCHKDGKDQFFRGRGRGRRA